MNKKRKQTQSEKARLIHALKPFGFHNTAEVNGRTIDQSFVIVLASACNVKGFHCIVIGEGNVVTGKNPLVAGENNNVWDTSGSTQFPCNPLTDKTLSDANVEFVLNAMLEHLQKTPPKHEAPKHQRVVRVENKGLEDVDTANDVCLDACSEFVFGKDCASCQANRTMVRVSEPSFNLDSMIRVPEPSFSPDCASCTTNQKTSKAKKNAPSCLICTVNLPLVACMPCRHLCLCNACAIVQGKQKDRSCPICRAPIQRFFVNLLP